MLFVLCKVGEIRVFGALPCWRQADFSAASQLHRDASERPRHSPARAVWTNVRIFLLFSKRRLLVQIGKDRTGLIGALILAVCGATDIEIISDYARCESAWGPQASVGPAAGFRAVGA